MIIAACVCVYVYVLRNIHTMIIRDTTTIKDNIIITHNRTPPHITKFLLLLHNDNNMPHIYAH
jgi:hypothetical protein